MILIKKHSKKTYADLKSEASHKAAPHFGVVNRYSDRSGSLKSTETEVNIREWGLEFSSANPLSQPRRYDVRCVWTTCSSSGSLLFTLYLITFRTGTKSCPVSLNIAKHRYCVWSRVGLQKALRGLVTIISKQLVIVPEQKFKKVLCNLAQASPISL